MKDMEGAYNQVFSLNHTKESIGKKNGSEKFHVYSLRLKQYYTLTCHPVWTIVSANFFETTLHGLVLKKCDGSEEMAGMVTDVAFSTFSVQDATDLAQRKRSKEDPKELKRQSFFGPKQDFET